MYVCIGDKRWIIGMMWMGVAMKEAFFCFSYKSSSYSKSK